MRTRIRAVESIKKLTHAIEMVAMAKSKSTENLLSGFKSYFSSVESLLGVLLSNITIEDNPFFESKPHALKKVLCVFTSDTGLCGSHNFNVLRKADGFMQEWGKDNVFLVTVGKKGFNHFIKKGIIPVENILDLHGRYSKEIAMKLLKTLIKMFLSEDVGEIYLAYTQYISPSRRISVLEKFLNVACPLASLKTEYILDPGPKEIANKLIFEYLAGKIKMVLLHAFASEHAARLIAMSESTKNAKELLESLILYRNKIRQATITSQILEVVSSAEAMKG
ncbi:MAG TPA: FoF1 ATP synthase subunit gamma [Candidatus Omnitrophota bacterium]|nr:FoF1 ATP synthase subunit gamma [Candidatus Omnitrophota bacterium]